MSGDKRLVGMCNTCRQFKALKYCGEGVEGLNIQDGDSMQEILETISEAIENSSNQINWGQIGGNIENQEDLNEGFVNSEGDNEVQDWEVKELGDSRETTFSTKGEETEITSKEKQAGEKRTTLKTTEDGFKLETNNVNFKGIFADEYYGDNADDTTYVQKRYVDFNKPRFYKNLEYTSTGTESNIVTLQIDPIENITIDNIQITPKLILNSDAGVYHMSAGTDDYNNTTGYITFQVNNEGGDGLEASKTLIYDVVVYA